MVLEGDGPRSLRVGLGHIPGTSNPGQPGNIGIAGHRDTFFRSLRRIDKGDEIIMETAAKTYRYRVSAIEIVEPQNVGVLSAENKDELTLVTCYPFSYIGSAPKRFVVHAEVE
jgi:sortase A